MMVNDPPEDRQLACCSARCARWPVNTNRETKRAIAAAVIVVTSGRPLDPSSRSSKARSQQSAAAWAASSP